MRILITAISLLLMTHPVLAQDQPRERPEVALAEIQPDEVPKVTPEKPMSFWMKHKLDYSKTMLESLTMGDFDELAETAEQMRVLGKIEGFVRRKNPAYRTQLKAFDLAAMELVRYAKQENADGATLAFNQMTTSCVACHSLLRKGVE